MNSMFNLLLNFCPVDYAVPAIRSTHKAGNLQRQPRRAGSIKLKYRSSILLALIVPLFGVSSLTLAGDLIPKSHIYSARSYHEHYQVTITSNLNPLQIGRMHSWVTNIATPDGRPVVGASIEVSGGMPAHNHGLPTSPRMTAELQEGQYLIEGVRFSMRGEWFILLTITANGITDSVSFDIDI